LHRTRRMALHVAAVPGAHEYAGWWFGAWYVHHSVGPQGRIVSHIPYVIGNWAQNTVYCYAQELFAPSVHCLVICPAKGLIMLLALCVYVTVWQRIQGAKPSDLQSRTQFAQVYTTLGLLADMDVGGSLVSPHSLALIRCGCLTPNMTQVWDIFML